MPRSTTRLALFGGGTLAAATIAACLGGGAPSGSVAPLATVNGHEITLDEYHAYAAVFAEPGGGLRVSPAQVLLSLINQELVAQEASRLGLAVDQGELESVVRGVTAESIGASIEDTGGIDAFRERLRAHMLMRTVKEAVLAVPVIEEHEVRAAYEADPALTELPMAEAWATLTGRLAARELDAAWQDWLASQRRCAIIVVNDPASTIALEGSGPC